MSGSPKTGYYPDTRFLICSYSPENSNIFIYHTGTPRFLVALEKSLDGTRRVFDFQMADMIDTVDESGKAYSKEAIDLIVLDMAKAFEKYVQFSTKLNVEMRLLDDQN
jgi:hypothetical protein